MTEKTKETITIIDDHCREIDIYGRRFRVHDSGKIEKWCTGNKSRDKKMYKPPYWKENISKPNNQGYLKLLFRHEGRLYTYNQSRLIYHCFFPDKLPDIQGKQMTKGCYVIDHIDGNKLNNNLKNLRLVTASQNIINIGDSAKNTSGYKHIRKKIDNRGNGCYSWHIAIRANCKNITKSFACKKDDEIPPQHVIDYRDKLVEELHGEYARLAFESLSLGTVHHDH